MLRQKMPKGPNYRPRFFETMNVRDKKQNNTVTYNFDPVQGSSPAPPIRPHISADVLDFGRQPSPRGTKIPSGVEHFLPVPLKYEDMQHMVFTNN